MLKTMGLDPGLEFKVALVEAHKLNAKYRCYDLQLMAQSLCRLTRLMSSYCLSDQVHVLYVQNSVW